MEVFIESDEETEIDDLRQLTAVLESDLVSQDEFPTCSSIVSTSTACSAVLQECSNIESAIALNNMMNEKLKVLESILIKRLQECRNKLHDLQSPLVMDKINKDSFTYSFCKKPYFKDAQGFSIPKNYDATLMEKSQMFDFSTVTSIPGWTVKDKSDFIELIKKNSIKLKQDELKLKITLLEKKSMTKNKKSFEAEIVSLKEKMGKLKSMNLNELALPINQEYDWESIAYKLGQRHTATEYQSLWKLFLHPSINKSTWTKTEHSKLIEIGKEHKYQDWDSIAKELNTGRTGYQCFVYYRTNMSSGNIRNKWSKEEEEYLKRLIEYYREGDYIPWVRVAASMQNRTKMQIYNKYQRLQVNRKGRFLPEEDTVLLNCVDKFGTDFKTISKYLPGRTDSQLSTHYKVLVNKFSSVWTVEEDKKLIQLTANQDSESYSSLTKFFPGKDRVTIRARYLTLVKWIRRNPNIDILHAPRRGARCLSHGKASQNLSRAVENLKYRIRNEVEIKKKKKITVNSSEDVLDDAIMVTLYNESLTKESRTDNILCEEKKYEDTENGCLADNKAHNMTNLKKQLILLNAKLNKELFDASYFSTMFPLDKEPEVTKNVIKKSYSRKQNVQSINIHLPDVWGKTPLPNPSVYVFPPNYATLTACKKLLSLVKSDNEKNEDPINVCSLMRKNSEFKKQISLLVERFNILFIWPLLLSNVGPFDQQISKAGFRFSSELGNAVNSQQAQRRKISKAKEYGLDLDEIKSMKDISTNLMEVE